MNKDECRHSTGISIRTFIVFDLHKRLAKSDPKPFPDDSSLFSTIQDITTSTVSLNHDLSKIFVWAVLWKMNFNPDPSKQAQELLFSLKK